MTNPTAEANVPAGKPMEKPKKKLIARILRIVIAILIVAAAAVFGGRWYIQLKTTVTTDNAKVAADLVSITSEVSGKITDVFVQEGEAVEAGQLIAKVDDSQYRINLSQVEAALAQAEAASALSQVAVISLPNNIKAAQLAIDKAASALAAAKAQAEICQLTVEDSKRALDQHTILYQQGVIAREDLNGYQTKYDTAVKNYEAANANVSAAQDTVATAQAQLDNLNATGNESVAAQTKQTQANYDSVQANYDSAQLALTHTAIISPIAGNVVKVSALQGQNLGSGSTVCTITNPSRIWITANIEEKKIGRIHIGDPVTFTVDAYPNVVFAGQVEEIGGATQSSFSILPTESTSGNFTKVAQRFPVKISVVQQEEHILRPGMSANVIIQTK
ncbi:MAG: HlyD family secretion protein [Peptococcaceae bacterium]|jgi:membrane fusion protein (multidrug efflux system)|nr:HlyD family secretion protein [Peptococcaceae bacterium]